MMRRKKKIEEYLSPWKSLLERNSYKNILNILNGNTRGHFQNWNLLMQILLYYFDDTNAEENIYFFIKNGADPNIRSKKGCNLFHLFIILMFYIPIQDESEELRLKNFFVKLLNFNFQGSTLLIINSTKIYSTLDLLYLLQQNKKQIIPQRFFPSNLNLSFHTLNKNTFNYLFTSLLTHEAKFFYLKGRKRNFNTLTNLSVYNLQTFFKDEEYDKNIQDLIYNYVLKRFNMIENEIDTNNITTIISKYIHLNVIKEKEHLPKDFSQDYSEDYILNKIYVNPLYINNSEFPSRQFIQIINENMFCFHENFLFFLINKKINPFTNSKMNNDQIDFILKILTEKIIFPISVFDSYTKAFPFIFDKLDYDDDTNNYKQRDMIAFIEMFFSQNHPYNQIHKLATLKPFQIKYIAYFILKETFLFPLFNKVYNKVSLQTLLDVLLFYARTKTPYMNIIFYFFEEIFFDFSAYDHLDEKSLDDTEGHSFDIFQAFEYRYGGEERIMNVNIESSPFFSKFIKSMYKLREFQKL